MPSILNDIDALYHIYTIYTYILFVNIYIYVAGTFGVYFVPPDIHVLYMHLYKNINDLHAYKNFSRKLHFFFVAQPAQRPFSDPKEAVTSRGKRMLL